MQKTFCVSIRYLQPYYHGRGDGGEPEWPPSPLRVFQAMTCAAAARWNERVRLEQSAEAMKWLESQDPPTVVAPSVLDSRVKYRLYVPDNTGDLAAGTWSRGDTTKAIRRTEKDICP